jgi:hypothetical protein
MSGAGCGGLDTYTQAAVGLVDATKKKKKKKSFEAKNIARSCPSKKTCDNEDNGGGGTR